MTNNTKSTLFPKIPEWIELPEQLGGGKVYIESIEIPYLPFECPKCGIIGLHYSIIFKDSPWGLISCESCNRFTVIEK